MKELISGNIIYMALLAIIVPVFYYRIALMLYFTRMIYGKYSFRFIQLSRKFYGDTPFSHGINVELIEHITHFKAQMGNAPIAKHDRDFSILFLIFVYFLARV